MYRRILLWILIAGFAWLVIARFPEIKNLVDTLLQGQWEWVLAAALIQVIYFIVFTYSYKSAFDTVEIKSRTWDLIPVTLSSIFVNVVAPVGGASGVALFVDDAGRRGESTSRATIGLLLQLIADFSAFTLILVGGMAYLFIQHDLKLYEVVTAIALLVITIGLAVIISLGLINPSLPHRLLAWLRNFINQIGSIFKRPYLIDEQWVEKNAIEFAEASFAIIKHPDRLTRTVGAALVAHFIDLSSLYALFLAFGYPIQIGPLVAGYAIGILFWVVSITPQGIGIVEGMMTLVYTSLGVPANIATVVSLAFRGLSFWLPMALGFIVLQRVKTFQPTKRAQAEAWNVRLMAILTALMGIINLFSAATPSLAGRMEWVEKYFPLTVRHGSHLTAAMAGFGLIILSGGLWRRKHVAWLLTLVILGISILSHLVKGLDYEEALIASGLAIWLITLRPYFHAKSDPPSIRQGIQALFIALVFTLFYGIIGFYLLDRHFSENFTLRTAISQTVVMFTQFYDPGLQPTTSFGRYFATSIYLIAGFTLTYALFLLIRPVLLRQKTTPAEQVLAQQIVESYGHSTLARMILFPDKSYYFTPGGSVIGYAAKGRAAVALGDPIGPPQDLVTAIQVFTEYCSKNDWVSAFYQTQADTIQAYRLAGFSDLCIGHEAIVDLATFSLEGHANKGIRSAVNRLTKLGYQATFYQPPISNELLETLRSISDEWLTTIHGSEKRFSLGWFDDDYLRNGPVVAIQSPQGEIRAFANIVSEYQRNEITIDLMRHYKEMENGTMDFLFVQLFQWAKDQGYATFNLGLSSLSGVGEQATDPTLEKFLHFIYEHINQFYNFKGLHEYKEKFHPTWSPRYIVFPNIASLPAIWASMARADAGDDFMVDYLKGLIKSISHRPVFSGKSGATTNPGAE
jgi:phosphatidylglycerol lysyltransferase